MYRRSLGLYEAATDIAGRVQRRQEHRHLLRRVVVLLCILAVCFVFAAIEDAFT